MSRWLFVAWLAALTASSVARGDEADAGPAGDAKPAAWKGNVALNLGAGTTQPTPGNPRTGDETGTLSGGFDPNDQWSVGVSLGLTRDNPTQASSGSAFGDSGGTIASFSAGPTWTPDDHWTVDLTGQFSPKSTTLSDTTLMLATARGSTDSDAQLKSQTMSWGLNLGGSYDTAGESAWEHEVGLHFGLTDFNTQQSVNKIDEKGRTVDLKKYEQTYCKGAVAKSKTCQQFAALTRTQPVDLLQFPLAATYTATLFEKTDVDVEGTWYFFNPDPTEIGYFSVATEGRAGTRSTSRNTARGGGQFDFGGGAPLQPLLFSTALGLSHTFGDDHPFLVALTGGYGDYFDGTGYNTNLAIKLQYRISKAWKVALTATGNRDWQSGDGTPSVTLAGTVGASVKYRF
jgi:hypothetical protein